MPLPRRLPLAARRSPQRLPLAARRSPQRLPLAARRSLRRLPRDHCRDRKSVVTGKSVDLGGRRIIKKKKHRKCV